MKKDKPLKPIVFHSSFEEQRAYSLQSSLYMTAVERLAEMYRLNRKIYGEGYGKFPKKAELYVGLPGGESVNDFYRRIDQEKGKAIFKKKQ